MDHTEAVAKNLTESYLLGVLTQQECEAFEEHYFTCAECAEDIKAAATLIANAKEVLKEEPSLSTATDRTPGSFGGFSWWRPAYSFAAVAAVLAILIYQNVVTIPRLKNRISVGSAAYSFIGQGSRGDSPPISIPYQGRDFLFYADITPNSDFVSYTCTIQSESGAPVSPGVTVTAEQAKDSISLLVPGSLLQPGKYVLVIQGNLPPDKTAASGKDTTQRHPFVVESKSEGTAKQ